MSLVKLLWLCTSACFVNHAAAKASARHGDLRVTALTPRLFRIENLGDSAEGAIPRTTVFGLNAKKLSVAEDEITTHVQEGRTLEMTTKYLSLRYDKEKGIENGLTIRFKEKINGNDHVVWRPTDRNDGQLPGTVRTLDGIDGSISLNCADIDRWDLRCQMGVVSRSGWVVVDDTSAYLKNGVAIARAASNSSTFDWYFFGHGSDYAGALQDFVALSGPIPLLPPAAHGVWISRWWPDTDRTLLSKLDTYTDQRVPVSIMMLDMDWHYTCYQSAWRLWQQDQANQQANWTGYTFDPNRFPDPKQFHERVHQRGVMTGINLHPGSGILKHEECYLAMKEKLGLLNDGFHIPFDMSSKQYFDALSEVCLKPIVDQGAGFWWLDYQQGEEEHVEGVSPTLQTTIQHWHKAQFPDSFGHQGNKGRAMVLARWGGLGGHRYPVGFSGDAFGSWDTLKFQVYFTATAANVGFGYWSHDIGAFIPKPSDEMFVRWVQWGVFSPILRLHSTSFFGLENERTPFGRPREYEVAAKKALRLRERMRPYLETMAIRAHMTGLSLLLPAYYADPSDDALYHEDMGYLFGSELFVAPVVAPTGADGVSERANLRLPKGKWVHWESGEEYSGPTSVNRGWGLDEVPVFAKAGAVIPLAPLNYQESKLPRAAADRLEFHVYPGELGGFTVRHDTGAGIEELEWSKVECAQFHSSADAKWNCKVATNSTTMSWVEVHIHSAPPKGVVTVASRAVELRYDNSCSHLENKLCAHWDADRFVTVIGMPASRGQAELKYEFNAEIGGGRPDLVRNGMLGKAVRAQKARYVLSDVFPAVMYEDAPSAHILAQTSSRILYDTDSWSDELSKFDALADLARAEVSSFPAKWLMSHGRNAQLMYLLGDGSIPAGPPLSFLASWFDFEPVRWIEVMIDCFVGLPVSWVEPVNRAFNEARYIDILIPFLKFLAVIGLTLACLAAGFWQARKMICGMEKGTGSYTEYVHKTPVN